MEQESTGGAAVEQESSGGAGERRWRSGRAPVEQQWSGRAAVEQESAGGAAVEQESGGGGEWWRRRAAGERGGGMHQAVSIHNSNQGCQGKSGKIFGYGKVSEKSGNFVMNAHDTFLAATKQL